MKREDQNLLGDPTVELISPYVFKSRPIEHDGVTSPDPWREVCEQRGGFNPVTREVTPMKFVSADMSVHEVLDHITAAVEAGVVDKNHWATQLFHDAGELDGFLDELECYDDCYRITDRWWTALADLNGNCDEEGFVSCSEIVQGLRESIDEGVNRCKLLRLEAEYFAANPLKVLELTEEQQHGLYQHNIEMRRKSLRAPAARDTSCDFRFPQAYFFMQSERLAAREVTIEDLAKLQDTGVQKSVATSPKPAARKKSSKPAL